VSEQQQVQNSDVLDQSLHPILVVDDDHSLRKTIQMMLEEEGFVVQTAADGQEAVEQAISQRPSLIILDMGLPLLDGSEVAAQVRTHYGGRVPVVLMTADGRAEEKSRRIGAASYLRKPFDIEDLIQMVEQALTQQQKQ
jgi:two-component system, NtrC family, response regulator AtoC